MRLRVLAWFLSWFSFLVKEIYSYAIFKIRYQLRLWLAWFWWVFFSFPSWLIFSSFSGMLFRIYVPWFIPFCFWLNLPDWHNYLLLCNPCWLRVNLNLQLMSAWFQMIWEDVQNIFLCYIFNIFFFIWFNFIAFSLSNTDPWFLKTSSGLLLLF
jgi:hypothetical protein